VDASSGNVLSIEHLRVGYRDGRIIRWAVDGVDLSVRPRERIGILGESGSGKSSLALATLGLARSAVVRGSVTLAGTSYNPTLHSMRAVRGSLVGLVLQDPLSSLNPVVPLGRQLEEVLTTRGVRRDAARRRAVALLDRVGIARAAERLGSYPREFSGGMRQRVVIAMALMASPSLLIADEPTTALDLRTQLKVLDLLRELCDEQDMALMLISHDVSVIAELAHRTVVLYAGRMAETGRTGDTLERPAHPYTAGLLASRPLLEGPVPERLPTIRGYPPRPGDVEGRCRFSPRCEYVRRSCESVEPELREVAAGGRMAACHFAEGFLTGELTPSTPAS
jgi:oligopeptide/dipeptide ABC transporter ATP-binding protein